ncbi:MAG: hypothetical protein ABII64_10800 [Elusimicrobiota bacterium]
MFNLNDDLLMNLYRQNVKTFRRPHEYHKWTNMGPFELANEFYDSRRIGSERMLIELNRIFETDRFTLLAKRWTVDYFHKLFGMLFDALAGEQTVLLENNPLNTFAVDKFNDISHKKAPVQWTSRRGIARKLSQIIYRASAILWFSLRGGIIFSNSLKQFTLLRESLWGLKKIGLYFHDDFLVDGNRIKKEELLLFSRGVPVTRRIEAYEDAVDSEYAHFELNKTPISLNVFFKRILPKYIFAGVFEVMKCMNNPNFSYFYSIFSFFTASAVPYERIFSNYRIRAELGHSYFQSVHIPESIVCQNYGTKYYLMHWSDNSPNANRFVSSFLSCDKFISWGKAHYRGVEGPVEMIAFTGYVFKSFIKKIMVSRESLRMQMGIPAGVFVATFYDESFGNDIRMTPEHFVNFWEAMLNTAICSPRTHVAMKSKELSRAENLKADLKIKFNGIFSKLKKHNNFSLIDENKWTFMEAIGISDLVVTQGMTSSATIAIICGIEGLYFDQAECDHPFSRQYHDVLAFDDRDKLVAAIVKIAEHSDKPSKQIPESTIRDFDAYADDLGIDRFRDLVALN